MKTDLYGVVLCGGRSSRMGRDKSMLNYHGIAQRYHVHNILQQFCDSTVISVNAEQQAENNDEYQYIQDDALYGNHGPVSGLLTAFSLIPQKSILMVGCDYPFVQASDIREFLSSIPKDATAAAFFNPEQFYEPVLSWYSQYSATLLKAFFEGGNTSLQEFLRGVDAYKYIPGNPSCTRSIDTYEQFLLVIKQIHSSSHGVNV